MPSDAPKLSLRWWDGGGGGGRARARGNSSGSSKKWHPPPFITTKTGADPGLCPLLSGLRVNSRCGEMGYQGIADGVLDRLFAERGLHGTANGDGLLCLPEDAFEASIACSEHLIRSWEAFPNSVFLPSRDRTQHPLTRHILAWAASLSPLPPPQLAPPSFFLDRVVIGEAWC